MTSRRAIRLLSCGFGLCLFAFGIPLGLSSAHADPAPRAVLTVRLALRNAEGQVGCLLFDAAKGFPKDAAAAVQRKWCSSARSEAVCPFQPMVAGTYAVVCFHDENGNGKLDTGLFGVPKEGTAASNDAQGFMGPPKFEDAKFVFAAAPLELRLKVSY